MFVVASPFLINGVCWRVPIIDGMASQMRCTYKCDAHTNTRIHSDTFSYTLHVFTVVEMLAHTLQRVCRRRVDLFEVAPVAVSSFRLCVRSQELHLTAISCILDSLSSFSLSFSPSPSWYFFLARPRPAPLLCWCRDLDPPFLPPRPVPAAPANLALHTR